MMIPKFPEMPDVILKTVTDNLDFESIQSLRKVSHRFRNFIDDKKIDFQLLGITVECYQSKIKLMLRSNTRYHYFFYHERENGCLVVKEKRMDPPDKTRFVKNLDFITVFLGEFENLLSHQKSTLEELNIYMKLGQQDFFESDCDNKLLEGIEAILKSRRRSLRVQKFYMLMTSQEDVLKVLPHVDPNFLRRIDLNHSHEYPRRSLEIEKLVDLERWKNAWELGIWRCTVSTTIQNFTHFSNAHFILNECTLDMLYVLKESLLQSHYFNQFKIYFNSLKSTDEEKIIQVFGEPLIDRNKNHMSRSRCFSKIPNSYDVLVVTIIEMRFGLRLNRVPLDFVPKKVLKKHLLY